MGPLRGNTPWGGPTAVGERCVGSGSSGEGDEEHDPYTSTGWMIRSAGAGASTGPPRRARFSHRGSLPTYSPGPRMTPGRRNIAPSPNTSATARSPTAFWNPYLVGDPSAPV